MEEPSLGAAVADALCQRTIGEMGTQPPYHGPTEVGLRDEESGLQSEPGPGPSLEEDEEPGRCTVKVDVLPAQDDLYCPLCATEKSSGWIT